MFILKPIEKTSLNYPKYLILLGNISHRHKSKLGYFFYYLIISSLYTDSSFKITKFPKYLVVNDLYFIKIKTPNKFNLSKLGTDYIINELCMHYKKECKGSYPDNYVFVNEPNWTTHCKKLIDRSPLKRSYP